MAPAVTALCTLAILSFWGPAFGEDVVFFQQDSKKDVDVNVNKNVNTICPDGHTHCPTGHTCCPAGGGRYNCCRYNSGTCCADQRTCCSSGCHCDVIHRRCLCSDLFRQLTKTMPAEKEPQQTPVQAPQLKEVSGSSNTICPDGSHCPDRHTCCPRGGRRYACCMYNSGTCCVDGNRCCPHGYRCNVRTSRCYREKDSIPAIFLLQGQPPAGL